MDIDHVNAKGSLLYHVTDNTMAYERIECGDTAWISCDGSSFPGNLYLIELPDQRYVIRRIKESKGTIMLVPSCLDDFIEQHNFNEISIVGRVDKVIKNAHRYNA